MFSGFFSFLEEKKIENFGRLSYNGVDRMTNTIAVSKNWCVLLSRNVYIKLEKYLRDEKL